VAIEHTAALFYSWSIRYLINRALMTVSITSALLAMITPPSPIMTINPAIITDGVNVAWENYKQHGKEHNIACHNYYCRLHGSSH